MEKITFPEIKLMVTLINSELPNIFTREIVEEIWKRYKVIVSLHDIYVAMDLEFTEDFELENRKLLNNY